MSRIANKFAELKKQNRKALIPYITAGDPTPEITAPLMHALVESGADLIELGVPFSEPMAEGPVIEAAHHRALEHKVSLKNVLAIVAEFRRKDANTPIILMGYLNPFEKMGYQVFVNQAQKSGVDATLIVDLPPEEADEWLVHLSKHAIDPIFLLAPTTTSDRIKYICEKAGGYHYYVSLKGVTGSKSLDVTDVEKKLKEIRQFSHLPIGVGFGIRDAESAAKVAKIADAVIVGTALVAEIASLKDQPEKICSQAPRLIKEMRIAIDMVK